MTSPPVSLVAAPDECEGAALPEPEGEPEDGVEPPLVGVLPPKVGVEPPEVAGGAEVAGGVEPPVVGAAPPLVCPETLSDTEVLMQLVSEPLATSTGALCAIVPVLSFKFKMNCVFP